MPYLGDFLGHLLAELSIARVQADLEALRLAELYAGHPLLKSLPVARFRLPSVTIDAPVAVQQMEEAGAGQSPRGGLGASAVRERLLHLLDLHLGRARIKLSAAERAHLERQLDDAVLRLDQPAYVAVDVTHFADQLAAAATAALREVRHKGEPLADAVLERLAAELRAAVRLELLKLRPAPPRLKVLVTTAELRDAGQHELMVRLHLTINEDAIEWIVTETPGGAVSKLVPE